MREGTGMFLKYELSKESLAQLDFNDYLNHRLFCIKGALSRIFRIFLNSQNIYLCPGKPANNGYFRFAIAILVH